MVKGRYKLSIGTRYMCLCQGFGCEISITTQIGREYELVSIFTLETLSAHERFRIKIGQRLVHPMLKLRTPIFRN